jgi:hypothetical protein
MLGLVGGAGAEPGCWEPFVLCGLYPVHPKSCLGGQQLLPYSLKNQDDTTPQDKTLVL